MSRRRAYRNRPERRQDIVTADLVDIGLLFVRVFGSKHGESYFHCTAVQPHVYQRVLLGPRREPLSRDGLDDSAAPSR